MDETSPGGGADDSPESGSEPQEPNDSSQLAETGNPEEPKSAGDTDGETDGSAKNPETEGTAEPREPSADLPEEVDSRSTTSGEYTWTGVVGPPEEPLIEVLPEAPGSDPEDSSEERRRSAENLAELGEYADRVIDLTGGDQPSTEHSAGEGHAVDETQADVAPDVDSLSGALLFVWALVAKLKSRSQES